MTVVSGSTYSCLFAGGGLTEPGGEEPRWRGCGPRNHRVKSPNRSKNEFASPSPSPSFGRRCFGQGAPAEPEEPPARFSWFWGARQLGLFSCVVAYFLDAEQPKAFSIHPDCYRIKCYLALPVSVSKDTWLCRYLFAYHRLIRALSKKQAGSCFSIHPTASDAGCRSMPSLSCTDSVGCVSLLSRPEGDIRWRHRSSE